MCRSKRQTEENSKILIAEDDEISRLLLKEILEGFGYQVDSVADGREAIAAHQATPYPIIVSDWMMPEKNGLDLCRVVRESGSADYTYFILLTANDESKIDEAMDAGVDDFLTKPINQREIKARLRVANRILNYANQISELEDMLPICSYCNSVRDEQNYWERVDRYITKRTGTSFSHSICPTCMDKVITPQLEAFKAENEGDDSEIRPAS